MGICGSNLKTVSFCTGFETCMVRSSLARRYESSQPKRVAMSQVPRSEGGSVAQATAMPPMTWNGTLTDATNSMTHYLHLAVIRCANCNGPVIVGSLGTRQDDISREINHREIGARCLACGFKPEIMVEPAVEHRFRPVQWNWVIRHCEQTADLRADQSSPELSPEAGPKL